MPIRLSDIPNPRPVRLFAAVEQERLDRQQFMKEKDEEKQQAVQQEIDDALVQEELVKRQEANVKKAEKERVSDLADQAIDQAIEETNRTFTPQYSEDTEIVSQTKPTNTQQPIRLSDIPEDSIGDKLDEAGAFAKPLLKESAKFAVETLQKGVPGALAGRMKESSKKISESMDKQIEQTHDFYQNELQEDIEAGRIGAVEAGVRQFINDVEFGKNNLTLPGTEITVGGGNLTDWIKPESLINLYGAGKAMEIAVKALPLLGIPIKKIPAYLKNLRQAAKKELVPKFESPEMAKIAKERVGDEQIIKGALKQSVSPGKKALTKKVVERARFDVGEERKMAVKILKNIARGEAGQARIPTGKEIAEATARITKIAKAEGKSIIEVAKELGVPAALMKQLESTQKPKTTDLTVQAKKYKTPEEFVKSQGQPVYHGTNEEFDNFIVGKTTGAQGRTSKHGIWFTDDKAEAIQYAKLAGKRNYQNQEQYEKRIENLVGKSDKLQDKGMFDEAEKLMAEAEKLESEMKSVEPKEIVREAIMPEKILVHDSAELFNSDEVDNVIIKAKKEGYDGVKFTNISDSPFGLSRQTNQYVVFNPDQIKSKQQLTDIWNKAQGEKVTVESELTNRNYGEEQYTFQIKKESKLIGEGTYSVNKEGVAKIGKVSSYKGSGSLGLSNVRQMQRDLMQQNPNVKKFVGDRVGKHLDKAQGKKKEITPKTIRGRIKQMGGISHASAVEWFGKGQVTKYRDIIRKGGTSLDDVAKSLHGEDLMPTEDTKALVDAIMGKQKIVDESAENEKLVKEAEAIERRQVKAEKVEEKKIRKEERKVKGQLVQQKKGFKVGEKVGKRTEKEAEETRKIIAEEKRIQKEQVKIKKEALKNAEKTGLLPKSQVKKQIRINTGVLNVGDVFEGEALSEALRKEALGAKREFVHGKKVGTKERKEFEERKDLLKKAKNEINNKAARIKGIKTSSLPIDYAEQIEFLQSKVESFSKGEQLKLARAESLRRFMDKKKEKGEEVFLSDEFFQRIDRNFTDMTMDELNDVFDEIEALASQARQANRLIADKKQRTVEIAIGEMTERIDEVFEGHKRDVDDGFLTPAERRTSVGQKIKDSADFIVEKLRKSEFVARQMDGEREGAVQEFIIEPIQESWNKEAIKTEESFSDILKAVKPIEEDLPDILSKIETFGKGREITKEGAMAVYANSLNEANLDRMLNGNELDFDEIDEIIKLLTPKEITHVNKILKIINDLYPETAAVGKDLTGNTVKKIEGIYFPIKVDRDFSQRAKLRDLEEDLFQTVMKQTYVKKGFIKSRTGGKEAIDMKFYNVVLGHINGVIHFQTHAKPVRDVQRLLNDPRVVEAFYESVGKNAHDNFKLWLRDTANPSKKSNLFEKGLDQIRSNTTAMALGLKVSVSLVQAGSVTQTVHELNKTGSGFRDTVRGFLDFFSDPEGMTKFIYEKSPQMKFRRQTFDRDVRDFLNSKKIMGLLKGSRGKRDMFFSLIAAVDKLATIPSWLAAYNQQIKRYGGKTITPDMEEAAVKFADGVARRTQPQGSPKDLARVQMGNATQKLFTMFYSHFANAANQTFNLGLDLKLSKDPLDKKVMKALSGLWWLLLVPSIFATFIKRQGKATPKEYLQNIGGYAAAMLPIIGSVYNSMVTGFDFKGSPVFNVVKEADRLISGKEFGNQKNPRLETRVKGGANLIGGYGLGLPTQQAWITATGFMDLMSGETSDLRRLFLSRYSLREGEKETTSTGKSRFIKESSFTKKNKFKKKDSFKK